MGDPDRLGVLRLNFRTGVAAEPALLKEMICADCRMVAEAGAATPGNRFRVRDFPGASHVGPMDPTPVADVLHTLARSA